MIDSGNGRKLERFGPYLLNRPAAQAVWLPQLSEDEWNKADALFVREEDRKWTVKPHVTDEWVIEAAGINLKISLTDFGHVGLFAEQCDSWEWIQSLLQKAQQKGRSDLHVLNLFAYSGAASLAAAKAGAHVCHLDASKGMVAWARENAILNKMQDAPIRWIVDDVRKFLKREIQRGRRYDGIILDPPTFGRGAQGEVFKIEEDLIGILQQCRSLLSEQPLFILFSSHSPGYTPLVLHHLLSQTTKGLNGTIEAAEMALTGKKEAFSLPSGAFARWSHEGT